MAKSLKVIYKKGFRGFGMYHVPQHIRVNNFA
jgi:hypothetical protein